MSLFFKLILLLNLFTIPFIYSGEKKKYPSSAFDQTSLKLEEICTDSNKIKIVIIPGAEQPKKPSGNHEYMAGAALLAKVFNKVNNFHAAISNYEWPKNEDILENVDVIVIYSNGDGKQGLLAKSKRIRLIDKLIEKGVGFVNLHAAICYPKPYIELGQKWIGGVWTDSYSKGNRGHWKSEHRSFPKHPIMNGVTPWKADDGWCHKILIPEENRSNLIPLLWSSKTHKGDPKGGDDDIVAWTFERKDGGRSFSCSGAHGHWEWANDGLRQMIINGILWTTKSEIPAKGFDCKIDKENMNQHFDARKK